MRFIEIEGPLLANRLGIAEPAGRDRHHRSALARLVFLPLVGFDRSGVRLGTGGGFYDRVFEFRRWRRFWHAPLLVGSRLRVPGTGAHRRERRTTCCWMPW